MQAGKINCEKEKALCKKAGVSVGKSARLFIYSYSTTEKGSLHEYSGENDAKSLKTFCQEHLPRFSRRVDISQKKKSRVTGGKIPTVCYSITRKWPRSRSVCIHGEIQGGEGAIILAVPHAGEDERSQ
jgi:hypothetical protein